MPAREEVNTDRNSPSQLSDAAAAKSGGTRLHIWILLGLVVGALAGLAVNQFYLHGVESPEVVSQREAALDWWIGNFTEPVGQLFLRLLLMLVIPLVGSSLLVGIAGMGDLRKLGRIGLKTVLYTVVISAISVVIGLSLVNALAPGKRIQPATAQALRSRYATAAEKHATGVGAVGGPAKSGTEAAEKPKGKPPLAAVVETLIPKNIIASLASDPPNLLHWMVFCIVLGIGVAMMPPEICEPLVKTAEALFAATTRLIELVMYLAPVAVACLLFTNLSKFGIDLVQALAWYIATVILGLAIHMFVVYSISVRLLSGISPITFFMRIRSVLLTAFSTSSSNATLPTAMRATETELGVPPEIGNFVLTVGATANQNGTALYEGVTVLFLAQLSGVELTWQTQLIVAYMSILGGIGTAGVPSGSIPFVALVLAQIGVEPTLIAIILGVDRILDMCRTTLNVAGDITAATFVARSEGYTLLNPPTKAVTQA